MKHLKCLGVAAVVLLVAAFVVAQMRTHQVVEASVQAPPPLPPLVETILPPVATEDDAAKSDPLYSKVDLIRMYTAHQVLYKHARALLSDEAFTDQMTQADYDEAWVLVRAARQELAKADSNPNAVDTSTIRELMVILKKYEPIAEGR